MTTNLTDHWLFIREDVPDGALVSCKEKGFTPVSLPHDWAVASPLCADTPFGAPQGYFDRWGVGWYRLHFTLPEKKEEKRYFLHFGGVFERSRVYLNENLLGTHHYGYSEFSFEVTEEVREGENLLAVFVDNSVTTPDRWYSGCGIYRPVTLEEVPEHFLCRKDFSVQADYDGKSGSLRIVRKNPEPRSSVMASVDGLFFETIPDSGVLVVKNLAVKPWSAEHPQLYSLSLSLPEEAGSEPLVMRIGFRRVEFIQEVGFFVNGERTMLKGVCLHHDGGSVGSAVTKPLLKQRLLRLKEMGCNAIRTSHNFSSCDLMDLCDEMGFYVLDECFDKWVQGSYARFYDEDVEEDLSGLILRDRNRPCVVAWSMGNEIDDQGSSSMLAILTRLRDLTKTLDGRPVTVALSPKYHTEDGTPIDERDQDLTDKVAAVKRVADIVDFISLNYQEQWYEAIHKACPWKLILGTEIYLAFHGRGGNCCNYSLESPLSKKQSHDYVIGGFLWAGVDYLGESMGFPSRGWGGAAISTNLIRKPISYLWQSIWSDAPVVHISILDYTKPPELVRVQWSELPLSDCINFPMFERMPMPYMIFTNCEEVRLSVNGEYYEIAKTSESEGGIIQGFLPLEPETEIVQAEGLRNGEVVCTHSLKKSGPSVKLQFSDRPSEVPQDLPAQMLFTVTAVDANGVPDRRESGQVHFTVEGPAVIEGVDNGYLCSLEPPASDRIHLHQGSASVILRLTGEGRIVLTAYGDGLISAKCVITKDGVSG